MATQLRKSSAHIPIISKVASPEEELNQREVVLAQVLSNPDVPTLPTIALQVIEKASDPECDLNDLAAILSQDPALCAKVLRTVNSIVFGARKPTSTIPAAVRRLGINPLRSLVLTLSLSSIRSPALPNALLQRYWRVSVAGALAARQLAVRAQRSDPDTELVSGLVRDLGILVLYQSFPAEYQAILDTSPVILSGFQCALEEKALQVNHAEVAAELLRTWHLPVEITEPVRFHHDWDGAAQLHGDLRDRAQLLYFASQVGQLQLTSDRPVLVREVLSIANQHFGMDEAELRDFLTTLNKQMEEFASILQVDLGGILAYSSVMSRGAEELARLSGTGARTPKSANGKIDPCPDRQPTLPGWGGPKSGQVAVAAPTEESEKWAETCDYTAVRRPSRTAAPASFDWMASSDSPSAILGRLDAYEVIEKLGQGAMGTVFRARDPRLDRQVAIKALLPQFANDPQARARFVQEGRSVAALTHENIVRVYTVGEFAGVPYLVMEYVKGMTLAAHLLREAPLPLVEIIRIGLQTASGLSVAHAQGMVHRDIKPANLLMEESTGRIKIADFGLALVSKEASLDQNNGLVGTPNFMSPEQADGQRLDPRSDMFSLGCVLYVACTGQLPFDGDTIPGLLRAICEFHPPSIRSLNPSLPAWLEEIVEGLLTKDARRRFPTATDMKRLFLCHWAKCLTVRRTTAAR
jgi:HD-like signal output (HDOD) protein